MLFEWDNAKRLRNFAKHSIDFEDAIRIWEQAVLETPSRRAHSEPRFLAVGMLDGRIITVVFTWRGGRRRLISARRARPHEQEDYHQELARRAARPD